MARQPRGTSSATPKGESRGPGRPAKNHNSAVATPALKAQALADYSELRGIVAAATAKVAASLKRFEGQGVDPAWVKFAYAEAKYTAEEAAKRHAERTEYLVATHVISVADAAWASSVIQGNLDLTAAAGEAADKVVEARAKRAGVAAGKKGHSLEANPFRHMPGSIEFVAWRDGHGDGLALRKMAKPGSENITEASTETTRREPPSAGPTHHAPGTVQ